MANRDALRDLQTRLAERMKAARNQERVEAWLAVECAGQGLLLPLAQAGEIFPTSALVKVPHTQPWFCGVANLRGALHGVVDLARFLGLRHQDQSAQELAREQSRLLALAPALGVNCALLVDRMAGLRNAGQLTRMPDEGTAHPHRPDFAGACWRDDAGRSWQEITLGALAANPRFLAIAA